MVANLMLLNACSIQQGYASAQAWRNNQCLHIMDSQERLRCLKEINQSYHNYSKEAEALRTVPKTRPTDPVPSALPTPTF